MSQPITAVVIVLIGLTGCSAFVVVQPGGMPVRQSYHKRAFIQHPCHAPLTFSQRLGLGEGLWQETSSRRLAARAARKDGDSAGPQGGQEKGQTFRTLNNDVQIVILVAAAVAGFAAVVGGTASSAQSWLEFFTEALARNGVAAFACFSLSDFLVQLMAQQKQGLLGAAALSAEVDPAVGLNGTGSGLDLMRSGRAGALGVGINALGYSFFYQHLAVVFPNEGPDQMLGELVAKVLTDALVWGTISNSLNLAGRVLLDGRGARCAYMKWQKELVPVTVSEWKFWPLWNALSFHFGSPEGRVAFNALGCLVWNIYISALVSKDRDIRTLVSNDSVKGTLLLIKGLPASIDEEYLKAIFKTYGTVTWTRMTAGVIGKKIYRCFSLFYFILLRFVTWTLMTAAPGDNRTSSGFVLFASEQVQILKRAVV